MSPLNEPPPSIPIAIGTQGFKAGLKWLRKLAKPFQSFQIHLVMEASGVYYLSLAKFFSG